MHFNGDESLNNIFISVKHLHYHRAVLIFEELGLFSGQPPILFELWHNDGLTQTELAQRRVLSAPTITATLKRMEKAGWVTRRPDSQDSRVSRVYLTEKGRNIRIPLEEKLKQFEDEIFGNFTDAERALLRRFLLQMWENLNKSGH